jgi:hypothetical protein
MVLRTAPCVVSWRFRFFSLFFEGLQKRWRCDGMDFKISDNEEKQPARTQSISVLATIKPEYQGTLWTD